MSKTKITYKKPRGGDGFGKKIHHYKKFDRLTESQQKDLLDKFLDETEGLNDSQLTKKIRDFLEAHGITINNQVITEIKIMIFQDRMKPKVALMSPEVKEKLKQADACNVLEAVYPFDRVASLAPFDSYGKIKAFDAKPSLAQLQKYFREDTAKERNAVLTSWDKYYGIVSYGYALDYHPSAMSHGLVSIVMHCGSDPWTFAHVIANTRLIFSDEIDWVRDWVSKYYPHWSNFLEDAIAQAREIRDNISFEKGRDYEYRIKLMNGSKVSGWGNMFASEFVVVEVGFEDGSVDTFDATRKAPQEHVRKAHRRRVRYGKGRKLTKWIEVGETLVNEGVS